MYLFVGISNSKIPIVTIDLIMIFGLAHVIISKRRFIYPTADLMGLIIIYLLFGALGCILRINNGSDIFEELISLRNQFVGILIFFTFYQIIDSKRIIDLFFKVLLVAFVIIALVNIKQIIYGMSQFELQLLGKYGSTLKEYDMHGRLRATSLFGDPLLYATYLTFVYFGFFYLKNQNRYLNKLNPVLPIFVLFLLSTTHMRSVMLGLFIGIVSSLYLQFRYKRKTQTKSIKLNYSKNFKLFIKYSFFTTIIVIAATALIAMDQRYNDQHITNSISSFGNMLFSESTDEFGITQSRDARMNAWELSYNYVLNNPFGDNPKALNDLGFSLTDVGLWKYFHLNGVVGAFAIIIFFILVAIKAYKSLSKLNEAYTPQQICLLSAMISVLSINGISEILYGTAISIWFWFIVAAILRYNKIKFYN